MGLTKATLVNVDTKERIAVLFNPTQYVYNKTTTWGEAKANPTPHATSKTVKGLNLKKREFQGGNPQTLTMDLFFDVLEQPGADVRKLYIEKLIAFVKVDSARKNTKTQKGRPPLCRFEWGSNAYFSAAMTSLKVSYTLFREDGVPVRATASVTLEEVEDEDLQKKQNPTSFSEPGRKRREVRPQDTLATIAYEEYGDPTKWRLIADDNRLDDPMAIRPGQVLSIPTVF